MIAKRLLKVTALCASASVSAVADNTIEVADNIIVIVTFAQHG